jgi:hypothetical protein
MNKQRAYVILVSIVEERVLSECTSRHKTLEECNRDSAHFKTAFKSVPAEINILQTSKFPLSKANHIGVVVVSPILISRGNHSVNSTPKKTITGTCTRKGAYVIDTFTSAPADSSIRIIPTCSRHMAENKAGTRESKFLKLSAQNVKLKSTCSISQQKKPRIYSLALAQSTGHVLARSQ